MRLKLGWMGIALALACGGEATDVTVDGELGRVSQAHSSARIGEAVLSTGVTLSYLEQGSPHGIPVIFLHGYTDSHRAFDLNLRRFPRRFHVFALDQRGHGDSSKPACCYEQSDFAADVTAFMDAVGLDRASLVGHSMGSFVAQQVALDYPDRVERLALIGSAPTVAGNPGALELKGIVDTLTDPIDPEFVEAFQASTYFQPIPGAFLDTAVAESLKVPADIWRQALDGLLAEDHSTELGNIEAPTLILFGDQDVFFTAAEQVTLDAEIPDSSLVVLPQTGHGTHVERPRAVNRELSRFLHTRRQRPHSWRDFWRGAHRDSRGRSH